MEDLISVIVPVYKAEPFLRRCVDSILKQSYTNLEIILVDDGSPDGCGGICDTYVAQDSRVRVIHQENRGVSAARNAGIDVARGQYFGFVDSDDWIEPTMYAELYQAIRDSNADLSVCDFGWISEDGEALEKQPNLRRETVGREEVLRRYAGGDGRLVVPWNKLYKRSLFDEIRYPPGKLHEDEFVTHKLLDRCSLVSIIPGRLYNHIQTENSITRSPFSVKRLDQVEGVCERVRFYQKLGDDSCLIAALEDMCQLYLADEMIFRPKNRNERRRWTEIKDMVRAIVRENAHLVSRKTRLKIAAPGFGFYILREGKRILRKVFRGARCVLQWLITLCRASASDELLLNTPGHSNLGDHAIVLAELQMLEEALPGAKVMECGGVQLDLLCKLEERGIQLPLALALRNKKNRCFIHGGGFLGELWQTEEIRFRTILQRLPNRKIIVFPQTVYFNLSDTWGRTFFEESKKIYSAHPDLTLFVREKNSYDFLRTHMPEVRVELAPDVVTCVRIPDFTEERKGVLLCIRQDLEGVVSRDDVQYCAKIVENKLQNEPVSYTDTVLRQNVPPSESRQEVYKKLREFSRSRLVITDRLHGMVFAAITGTPCICLNNCSGKVAGVYEWIKDNRYVQFINGVDEFEEVLDRIDLTGRHEYHAETAKKAMAALMDEIGQT